MRPSPAAPTNAPRVSPAGRRWCVPPAILLDGRDTLEGSSILDEFRGPLGVYLWQRVRDVALWADTPVQVRGATFAPEAAEAASRSLRPCGPDAIPAGVEQGFARLLAEPHLVTADEVSANAAAVATWARARGADATALAYTQAAALASPENAERALAVGVLAAGTGQPARAGTWLRRTVALARRSGEWSAYVRAYLELGAIRERQGDPAAAWRLYLRAARGARRHAVTHGRSAAYHGMMRIALREGRLEDAERLGRLAQRHAGTAGEELRHDLAELAVLRGEGGDVVPVLKALLPGRADLAARIHTLGLLCRAAAQAADRATLEEVWPAVEELARAARSGVDAGAVLLELASAAAATGAVRRAEVVARVAAEHARTAEAREEARALLRNLFR